MDADDRGSNSGDEGRKSLEHFRAKLKQLRPLSLGSIVGSRATSGTASDTSSSSTSGLSLTAAAAVAAASSAAALNGAKRAQPSSSWTQPGHPNPSVLNVSAQVYC